MWNVELQQMFFEDEGLLFLVMKLLSFSKGSQMVLELYFLILAYFTQLTPYKKPHGHHRVHVSPCFPHHFQTLSFCCADMRKSL